jgi:choline dehydrogenase-like flavoprotein
MAAKLPPQNTIKICIYGAGAIGGYLGVQLARASADVSLVARGTHLAAMRANGLTLLIGNEERLVRPLCSLRPECRRRSLIASRDEIWLKRGAMSASIRSAH